MHKFVLTIGMCSSVILLVGLISCGEQRSAEQLTSDAQHLKHAAREPEESVDSRPNIVLIVIETLRPEFLGCYDRRSKLTPEIDQLAERSVLFENAVAQSSWTRPSVAALLTSTYPSTNGVVGRTSEDMLSASFSTMAEILESAGYDTFGITTNSNLIKELGFAQGYQIYSYAERAEASALNLAVKNWLSHRQCREKPFFVHLHYYEPHKYFWNSAIGREVINPPRKLFLDPPDAESSLNLRSTIAYYQMKIKEIDAGIGELMDVIESYSVREDSSDTLVILTADHGEELLDHGGFWHLFTLYPEVTHVPLLIRYPKWLPHRVSPAVQHIDVLPTILDLIDSDALPQMEGKSLLPLVEGSQQSELHDLIFSETFYHDHIVAVRSDSYFYILNLTKNTEELFHHQTDPWGQNNVVSSRRDVAAQMRKRVLEYLHTGRASREELRIEQSQVAKEDWKKISARLEALGYVRTGSSRVDEDILKGITPTASWAEPLWEDKPVWRSLLQDMELICREDPRIWFEPVPGKRLPASPWVGGPIPLAATAIAVDFPNIRTHDTLGGRIVIKATFSQAIVIFRRSAWSGHAEIAVDSKVLRTVDLRMPQSSKEAPQFPVLLNDLGEKQHVVTIRAVKKENRKSENNEVIFQGMLVK